MKQDACVLNLGPAFQEPTWLDVSGHGNNGVMTGAFWRHNAMFFDGVDDFAEIENVPILDFGTNNFTIEMLFYLDSIATWNLVMTNTSGTTGYSLLIRGSTHYPRMRLGADAAEIGTGRVELDEWTHLVIPIDRSDKMTSYINGVDCGNIDISAWGSTVTNNVNHFIGKMGSITIDGKIALARVYNEALSAQQILELYQQTYKLI